MEEEYYIGQIFDGKYPQGAADFCNETQTAMITEIEPIIVEDEQVRRFQIVEVPKYIPTKEEQEKKRANAYVKEVDPLHAQKNRRTILGTWTDEDEAEYREKVIELSEAISERYPYPTEE